MSIRLRTATSADALTLLEIQREASLAAFPHIFPPGEYPFPSEQVLRRWQEQLAASDARVLIAERNDHPVGTAAYGPGRFDQLWVVPSEWGSGLSQVVYDEVLRGLTELGAASAVSGCSPRTTVRASSTSVGVGDRMDDG
jgi:hypothetical protein